MAQKRKIVILSALLGVLVVVYVFGSLFTRDKSYSRDEQVLLLGGIDLESVYSITFSDSDGSRELTRDPERGWMVSINNELFPASSYKIDTFLNKLKELRTSRLVSAKEENYRKLGITDQARRIILKNSSGEPVKTVIIGLPAGGQGRIEEEYVRTQNNPAVYVIREGVGFYVNQDANYWSDLDIIEEGFTSADINDIALRSKGVIVDDDGKPVDVNYTISRSVTDQQPQWTVSGEEGQRIDPSRIENLVGAVNGIRGDSFVTDVTESEAGLDNPRAEIHISTGNNRQISLWIGDSGGDDTFFTRSSERPYLYRVKSWHLERIFVAPESLLMKDPQKE